MVSFLLVGLIPLAVTAGLTLWKSGTALSDSAYSQLVAMRDIKEKQVEQYFEEREGDMGVLMETVGTLHDEAVHKLTAVREIKRAAVGRYLQSITDQMHTFSEDRMIVDAMIAFREAFPQVRNEREIGPEELERMGQELKTYYTGFFTEEYKAQNDGASPNAEQLFEQLDADTIALQYAYIQANPNPLGEKHKLDRSPDASTYSEIHGRVHPIVRSYLEKFGYYDIFLCDPVNGRSSTPFSRNWTTALRSLTALTLRPISGKRSVKRMRRRKRRPLHWSTISSMCRPMMHPRVSSLRPYSMGGRR